MSAKKRGLGKGLGALMGDMVVKEHAKDSVQELPGTSTLVAATIAFKVSIFSEGGQSIKI
jgi:hypothetical protein